MSSAVRRRSSRPACASVDAAARFQLYPTRSDAALQLEDLRAIETAVGTVRAAIRRYSPPSASSEDVLGETYLALVKARRLFDPGRGASYSAYAYRAIRNALVDLARFEADGQRRGNPGSQPSTERRSRHYKIVPFSQLDAVDDDGEIALFEEVTHECGQRDASYESIEYADVRKFVRGLPERQRVVVELVYWDGLSPAQAARFLGISRAAVSDLLHKVCSKGRQVLAAHRPFTETTRIAN